MFSATNSDPATYIAAFVNYNQNKEIILTAQVKGKLLLFSYLRKAKNSSKLQTNFIIYFTTGEHVGCYISEEMYMKFEVLFSVLENLVINRIDLCQERV